MPKCKVTFARALGRATTLAVLLLGGLFSVACEYRFQLSDYASWSPGGTELVMISPENDSELVLIRWPETQWQVLGRADEGRTFQRPIWLQDDEGRDVITVLEVRDKSRERSDPIVRFIIPGEGFAEAGSGEMSSMRIADSAHLKAIQAGPEGRSLIYAAGQAGSWKMEEFFVGSEVTRLIALSSARDSEALISTNGRRMAILETPVFLSRSGSVGSRLSIYPTRTVWSGPLASWEFGRGMELVSWSPDGVFLLVHSKQYPKALLLLRGGDQMVRVIFSDLSSPEVSWSPNSRSFALSAKGVDNGSERQVWIYHVIQDFLSRVPAIHFEHFVGWSHDVTRLLYLQSFQGSTRLTDFRVQQEWTQILRHDNDAGEFLLSPSQDIGLWLHEQGRLDWLVF